MQLARSHSPARSTHSVPLVPTWVRLVLLGVGTRLTTSGRKEAPLEDDKVLDLARDIRCGPSLARDLLALAGDDARLVREASDRCRGVESMKAYIIDHRISRLESRFE